MSYLLLPLSIVMAICCGIIANNKKRSIVVWVILGLLFGPIALIILLFLRELSPPQFYVRQQVPRINPNPANYTNTPPNVPPNTPVNTPIPPSQQTGMPPPPPPGANKSKNTLIIAIVAVVVAVGIGGYFYNKNKNKGKNQDSQVTAKQEKPAEFSQPTPMNDIRQFTNEQKMMLARKVVSDSTGPYDPVKKGWDGAGESEEDRMFVTITRLDVFEADGQPTLQILTKGKKTRFKGRNSKGHVSAHIVVPYSVEDYAVIAEGGTSAGFYGNPPEKGIRMSVGKGIMAWQLWVNDRNNGVVSRTHLLMVPNNGSITTSTFLANYNNQGQANPPDGKKYDLTATYDFDRKSSDGHRPMLFTVRGTVNNVPITPKTVTVPFNDTDGTYNPPDIREVAGR